MMYQESKTLWISHAITDKWNDCFHEGNSYHLIQSLILRPKDILGLNLVLCLTGAITNVTVSDTSLLASKIAFGMIGAGTSSMFGNSMMFIEGFIKVQIDRYSYQMKRHFVDIVQQGDQGGQWPGWIDYLILVHVPPSGYRPNELHRYALQGEHVLLSNLQQPGMAGQKYNMF